MAFQPPSLMDPVVRRPTFIGAAAVVVVTVGAVVSCLGQASRKSGRTANAAIRFMGGLYCPRGAASRTDLWYLLTAQGRRRTAWMTSIAKAMVAMTTNSSNR